MRSRRSLWGLVLAFLPIFLGCGDDRSPITPNDLESSAHSASIIGRISDTSSSLDGTSLAAGGYCPEVVFTLNGSPVQIHVDDDCSFVLSDVFPSDFVVLRIEIPEQSVSGSVELEDIAEGELIEILVRVDSHSLVIAVVRRARPNQLNELPEVIYRNNVEVMIEEGVYVQDLTVNGNNFVLVGEHGRDCDDSGWSVLDGRVVVSKNNATFRNIVFAGPVIVRGNNARFINCCIDGELILFGNNTDIDHRDHDDDDDDDDDHDDDHDGDD